MRSPRVLARSFTLIPAPFTAGVPCSYWTSTCAAALSTLHSLLRDFCSSGQCFASGFLQTPPHGDALASGCILPTAGRIGDFHPLERAPAGRTTKIPGRSCSQGSCYYYEVVAPPAPSAYTSDSLISQPPRCPRLNKDSLLSLSSSSTWSDSALHALQYPSLSAMSFPTNHGSLLSSRARIEPKDHSSVSDSTGVFCAATSSSCAISSSSIMPSIDS